MVLFKLKTQLVQIFYRSPFFLVFLSKEEKLQTPNYQRSVEEKIQAGFCGQFCLWLIVFINSMLAPPSLHWAWNCLEICMILLWSGFRTDKISCNSSWLSKRKISDCDWVFEFFHLALTMFFQMVGVIIETKKGQF